MNDKTRIVLGYDGSPESSDALALARDLARLENGEVTVVSSVPYDALYMGPEAYEREIEKDTAPLLEDAREALGDIVAELVRIGGYSPAEALSEVATRDDSDMIVIGSSHRGALGRVFLGSVGESLLSGAPCAVAIAPRDYGKREHYGLGVVGVGYDDSEESSLALIEGERLATASDAKLRLITSVPVFESAAEGGVRSRMVRAARERLDSAAASLSGRIEVETVLEDGPADQILATHGVELDLLLLGSRGYGPLRRVLLGSVSTAVIRRASCPVIVVPRPAAERADRRLMRIGRQAVPR